MPDLADGIEQGDVVQCHRGANKDAEWRVAIRSDQPLRAVSITLLDHHAEARTAPLTVATGPAWAVYKIDIPQDLARAYSGVEALHARVAPVAAASDGWDFFTSPSVYFGAMDDSMDVSAMPVRPTGTGPFSIGAPRPERPRGPIIGPGVGGFNR